MVTHRSTKIAITALLVANEKGEFRLPLYSDSPQPQFLLRPILKYDPQSCYEKNQKYRQSQCIEAELP